MSPASRQKRAARRVPAPRRTPDAGECNGSPTKPSSSGRPMTCAASATASRCRRFSRPPPAPRATSCTARRSRRPEVRRLLAKFDVARFGLARITDLTTPDGGKSTTRMRGRRDLARRVHTDARDFRRCRRTEVFRIDAYLRPFHLASALDYVASGAYRDEPSFQRFVQTRAERLRVQGETVDLWQ